MPKDGNLEEFLQLHGKTVEKSGDIDSKVEEKEVEMAGISLEDQLLKQMPPNEKNFLIISGLPTSIKVKNLKEFILPVRLKTVRLAKGILQILR